MGEGVERDREEGEETALLMMAFPLVKRGNGKVRQCDTPRLLFEEIGFYCYCNNRSIRRNGSVKDKSHCSIKLVGLKSVYVARHRRSCCWDGNWYLSPRAWPVKSHCGAGLGLHILGPRYCGSCGLVNFGYGPMRGRSTRVCGAFETRVSSSPETFGVLHYSHHCNFLTPFRSDKKFLKQNQFFGDRICRSLIKDE
ncbi:hypothetical protein YC2023_077566 [Brassica napus]